MYIYIQCVVAASSPPVAVAPRSPSASLIPLWNLCWLSVSAGFQIPSALLQSCVIFNQLYVKVIFRRQFWAAYVPCDAQHRDAVQLTFEQIDLIQRLTDKYHPQLTLCTSAEGKRPATHSTRYRKDITVRACHALGH